MTDIGVAPDCAARIAAKVLQDSAAGKNACIMAVQDIEAMTAEALGRGR